MRRTIPFRAGRIGGCLLAAFSVFLLAGSVSAQDDDFPDFRPSPKIELSENEASALAARKDPKKYLSLALELMEARIKSAEDKNGKGEHDSMLAELGGFNALIDTTIDFLLAADTSRGRVLDTVKRYEIALRRFTPRIENVRRDAPEKYSSYISRLLKRVRENRARAIEPFFGDSVVPTGN